MNNNDVGKRNGEGVEKTERRGRRKTERRGRRSLRSNMKKNNMQNKYSELPKRKLHRLQNYDYGNGCFFITLCTNKKQNILCEIVGNDAHVVPSKIGQKVIECFNNIEILNENIEIVKFVLMPNHIHAIIAIKNSQDITAVDKKYGFEIDERWDRRSLQGVIKDFKSVTTRIYKNEFSGKTSLWQKSFYDEVIENDEHFQYAWQYINENPRIWSEDKYFSW